MLYNAIDLFSGCGGMTEGLISAGFHVVAAVEIDKYAAEAYRANHEQHGVTLFETDIRLLESNKILELLQWRTPTFIGGLSSLSGIFITQEEEQEKVFKRFKEQSYPGIL